MKTMVSQPLVFSHINLSQYLMEFTGMMEVLSIAITTSTIFINMSVPLWLYCYGVAGNKPTTYSTQRGPLNYCGNHNYFNVTKLMIMNSLVQLNQYRHIINN